MDSPLQRMYICVCMYIHAELQSAAGRRECGCVCGPPVNPLHLQSMIFFYFVLRVSVQIITFTHNSCTKYDFLRCENLFGKNINILHL